jgi:hypothetical protein
MKTSCISGKSWHQGDSRPPLAEVRAFPITWHQGRCWVVATSSKTISRDNFLEAIFDEGDRWSPDSVREILPTMEVLDALYLTVAEQVKDPRYDPAGSQLPLMLGKSIHLNLTALASNELKDITVAAAILLSIIAQQYTDELASLAGGLVAFIPAILRSATRLKKQLGEICLLEVIHEGYLKRAHTGPTARIIAYELNGEKCRYPGQYCRYEDAGLCTIEEKNVEATLLALEEKQVVEKVTHEEPYEWKISF